MVLPAPHLEQCRRHGRPDSVEGRGTRQGIAQAQRFVENLEPFQRSLQLGILRIQPASEQPC
jgi:hypothetical protein